MVWAAFGQLKAAPPKSPKVPESCFLFCFFSTCFFLPKSHLGSALKKNEQKRMQNVNLRASKAFRANWALRATVRRACSEIALGALRAGALGRKRSEGSDGHGNASVCRRLAIKAFVIACFLAAAQGLEASSVTWVIRLWLALTARRLGKKWDSCT